MFFTTLVFSHFKKYSTTTITYFLYPIVWGKGPRMLMPHWENDYGVKMLVWGTTGVLIAFLNRWQTSHFFTKISTLAFKVGQ